MQDLISRQAAIDALHMHLMYRMGTDSNKKRLDEWINNLPSAQPEIIRCEDCMHNGSFDTDCPISWNGKEYCSFAERSTDEQSYQQAGAIDLINSIDNLDAKAQGEICINLMGLPSVQPEQTKCDYCHEDVDGYVKPIEKNCHAFVRFGMDGWELSLQAKGWHGSAKIRYCPMCGRDLLVK